MAREKDFDYERIRVLAGNRMRSNQDSLLNRPCGFSHWRQGEFDAVIIDLEPAFGGLLLTPWIIRNRCNGGEVSLAKA